MTPHTAENSALSNTTNLTTIETGNKMWGWSLEIWDKVVFWSLVVAAVAGTLSVTGGLAAGLVSYWTGSIERTALEEKLRAYNSQLEKARTSAAVANKAASDANERAADLTERANEARLETEKIKAQLAWRRLTHEQIHTISNAIGPISFPFKLSVLSNDPEATLFANDFVAAMKAGGKDVKLSPVMVMSPRPLVGIRVSGREVEAITIAKILATAGLKVVLRKKEQDVEILIASKPAPIEQ